MTLKEIEMLIKCKQYVETRYKVLTRQLENMQKLGKDTKYIQVEIAAIENIFNKGEQ